MSRSEKNKMNNNRNRMRIENDRREARQILSDIQTLEDIEEYDDDLTYLTEVRHVEKTKMKDEKDKGVQKPRWERVEKRVFEDTDSEQERGE